MAHTKAKGSARINKDSRAKRLGVKRFSGEQVQAGMVIVRQKGTKFKPGVGTKLGNDYTLFATQSGKVQYYTKLGKKHIRVV